MSFLLGKGVLNETLIAFTVALLYMVHFPKFRKNVKKSLIAEYPRE
jgi:hypothetical protein